MKKMVRDNDSSWNNTYEKDMVPVLVCVEEVVEDVVLELMLN
jgi:hypothetical protein